MSIIRFAVIRQVSAREVVVQFECGGQWGMVQKPKQREKSYVRRTRQKQKYNNHLWSGGRRACRPVCYELVAGNLITARGS